MKPNQSDRDAAADLWALMSGLVVMPIGKEWQPEWTRTGTFDAGPVVQAFTRHRLAAEAAAIERAAKVAETYEVWTMTMPPILLPAPKNIAALIRNLTKEDV